MKPSQKTIDIEANRKDVKWSARQNSARVLWALLQPMFRFSPRPMWTWRNALLRAFGAEIGRSVRIFPSTRIEIPWNLQIGDFVGVGDGAILYALGAIVIGDRATISQNAHICAGSHDYRGRKMPLTKPPIEIGAEVWVCADAFVGPGVKVGDRAIVGARAVVTQNVECDWIVAGNPATKIGDR